MNQTTHIDGRVFSIDQPVQTLYGFGPNENWTYTDKAGHKHFYRDGYPTLVLKKTLINHNCYDDYCGECEVCEACEDDCCDECDRFYDEHYECSICGEIIRPTSSYKPYYIQGKISHTIDGVPVSEEIFTRELARACESVKPKANGWVFLQFPKGKYFGLVRKEFWEKNKHLNDQCTYKQIEDDGIDIDGFSETMESCFEYLEGYKTVSAQERYQNGLKRLLELGFEEVENPFDDDDWDDDDDDDEFRVDQLS